MKKSIKIVALLLCIGIMGVLFCGCDYLDQQKASHGILSEDKQTITFRGNTYKYLEGGENIYIPYIFNYSYVYSNDVTVTDADVPVLVKDAYSYYTSYNEYCDIFSVEISENTTDDLYNTYYTSYFCNEKDYEKYSQALANNKLDRIGVEFYKIIDNDNGYKEYYNMEVLSESASNEILSLIGDPYKLNSENYDEIMDRYDSVGLQNALYKCDADAILAENCWDFDVYRDSEGNVYLVNYTVETAAKLSQATAEEFVDKFFYTDYILY